MPQHCKCSGAGGLRYSQVITNNKLESRSIANAAEGFQFDSLTIFFEGIFSVFFAANYFTSINSISKIKTEFSGIAP